MEPIEYKIFLNDLNKHLLVVECTIKRPNEQGQIISFPAWVPGSYLIRDFARHVVALSVSANGVAVAVEKTSKSSWQCAPCNGPLVINYSVYCFDLAARGAYVDHNRVFFDGCRIFLVVEGEEEQTRIVNIVRPQAPQTANWRCATSMAPYATDTEGFGSYIASNHLDLIDHPFEISDFKRFDFVVADVPHSLVVTGQAYADYARLVQDVTKICLAQIDFFGELPKMTHYIFILSVLAKGGGGIEHKSSCSLICTRSDLPGFNNATKEEDYKALLGLFSHEYFHLWNVKRIKPEVFINPDLTREVYTRQLWIFEGFTSYFDNLNLFRAGVITVTEYLRILQDDINVFLQTPGANMQTLQESSFDAWIKYYQPDENSINSGISYYLKGALVALLLDLLIIKNSKRKQSLVDVMQILWQQYGKAGLGLPEGYFQRILFEVTGEDYASFCDLLINTTEELDFVEPLLSVGIVYATKPAGILDNLGVKVINDQNKVLLRAVLSDSAAEQAGLAANDVLVAINGFAVNYINLEMLFNTFKSTELIKIHIFRNEVLREIHLYNTIQTKMCCELTLAENLSQQQSLHQQKWLGVVNT